ncbi:MAG: DNA polymerase III subunit delta [Thermodesulfobacteriota bacterium]
MPLLKRQDLSSLLASAASQPAPAYLFFGDRYLCQEAVERLIGQLLPDPAQRQASLQNIDGGQEDVARTISLLKTFSLFGGRQVARVVDSRLFHSKVVAGELWDKALKAHAAKDQARAGRFLVQMLALADLAPAGWQEEGLAEQSQVRWRELFGFDKPAELAWVAETLAGCAAGAAALQADAAEALQQALTDGLPGGNTLILIAEAVDRRKKLFKFLEKHGVVVDLSVETGSTKAAKEGQQQVLAAVVEETLRDFGKRIEPRALPVLLERVGISPVAAAMEAEKLALFAGEAPAITLDDINAMVGRTREEALFELNNAVAGQDLAAALAILSRLRQDGMHPLAMVAGLRNFLRRLLLLRAFIEQPGLGMSEGLSFAAFQKGVLPRLSEEERFAALFGKKGKQPHPFAVYNSLKQAAAFPLAALREALAGLLEAEYRLKGSGLPEFLVLEEFLFGFLNPSRPRPAGQKA